MITAADLTGLWRRDWIKAPGFQDHTTRVAWWQSAGGGFVDLRVPADLPDLGDATCLADLDPPALRSLLRAEGFAGTITVENGTCTWQRASNWHGFPTAPDVGRMTWDAGGGLVETGAHADYAELWQRAGGSAPQFRTFRRGTDALRIIWDDAGFMLGSGAADAPASAPLLAALVAGERPAPRRLAAQFAALYARGVWDGGAGVVTLATDPFVQGAALLSKDALAGAVLTLERQSFTGALAEETWNAP